MARSQFYSEDEALAAAIAASEKEAKRIESEEASFRSVLGESKIQVSADPRAGHHLTLYHYPKRAEEKKGYFKIKIPGGGNCGFYAIALGVINLIVQDKISLTTQKYNILLNLLKKGKARDDINVRLEFYRTGKNPRQLNPPRLEKCVPFIDAILKEIDQGRLASLEQLKAYILQNMHSQQDKDYFLESMLIVLGPVLREVSGVEFDILGKGGEVKKEKKGDTSTLLDPSHIEMQRKDGVNAPEEQLNLLSGFFDFEFKAYLQTPRKLYFKSFATSEATQEVTNPIALVPEKERRTTTDEKSVFQECPDFVAAENLAIQTIYNPVAQHWDLLLPRSELQSPPYLFSPFESLMIQDQIDPQFISLRQYISGKKEADQGKPAFDLDSYFLIADEKKNQQPVWHFVHVNSKGEHHSFNIEEIDGLQSAIQRLPKKDPGSMEAKDKREVVSVVERHLRKGSLQVRDSKTKDVFDEKQVPIELGKIIDESRKEQEKLFLFLDSISAFENEVKKITSPAEKKIGEELVKTLRETANTLVDQSAQDENRIAAYRKCLNGFDTALQGMPSMTPSCANTLLNIIAGIFTIGIWHSNQRYKTGQWTLFNDLKANFYHTKREFESLTEQVKKLDNDLKSSPTPRGD